MISRRAGCLSSAHSHIEVGEKVGHDVSVAETLALRPALVVSLVPVTELVMDCRVVVQITIGYEMIVFFNDEHPTVLF